MTRIDSDNWRLFADRFTRQHDGWSASLELRQVDGGVEVAVDDRPFRGMTVESHDGHEELILSFGDDPDEHLAHIVEQPTDLAVLDDEADECWLVIGLPDGTGCVLELTNPFSAD